MQHGVVTTVPVSLRCPLICAHASSAISSGVQSRALLPLKLPGVDQSEMIADSSLSTVPSPYVVRLRLQNCSSLIDVIAQPEST